MKLDTTGPAWLQQGACQHPGMPDDGGLRYWFCTSCETVTLNIDGIYIAKHPSEWTAGLEHQLRAMLDADDQLDLWGALEPEPEGERS